MGITFTHLRTADTWSGVAWQYGTIDGIDGYVEWVHHVVMTAYSNSVSTVTVTRKVQ